MLRRTVLLLTVVGFVLLSGVSAVSAQEPVVLNIFTWSSPGYTEKYLDFANKYMKQRFGEHIHVEGITTSGSGEDYTTKLTVLLASGVGPDVFHLNLSDFVPHWVESGFMLPLDEYLAQDPELVKGIAPSLLDAWRYEGRFYGIPASIGQYAVYYNRDRFNERGLAYPSDNWTIDGEFIDTIRRLQEVGEGGELLRYGISLQTTSLQLRFMNYIMSNGGNVVDEKVTKALINQPEFVDTIVLFNELIQQQITARGNSGQAFTRFVSEEAAMFMSGIFYQPRVTTDAKFNWGVAPFPLGTAGRRTAANTNAWSVNPHSQHLDLAIELAKAFATPDYAEYALREGLDLPVNLEVLQTEFLASLPPNLSPKEGWIWLEAIDYMIPYPKHELMTQIWSIASSELSAVWAGRENPANALTSAAQRINALLESSR